MCSDEAPICFTASAAVFSSVSRAPSVVVSNRGPVTGVNGTAHNSFRRVEVVAGQMVPPNLQEIISGLKPGDRVVSNALVLQNTVEQ